MAKHIAELQEQVNWHWRNSMRPVRFFNFDVKAAIPLFFLLFYARQVPGSGDLSPAPAERLRRARFPARAPLAREGESIQNRRKPAPMEASAGQNPQPKQPVPLKYFVPQP